MKSTKRTYIADVLNAFLFFFGIGLVDRAKSSHDQHEGMMYTQTAIWLFALRIISRSVARYTNSSFIGLMYAVMLRRPIFDFAYSLGKDITFAQINVSNLQKAIAGDHKNENHQPHINIYSDFEQLTQNLSVKEAARILYEKGCTFDEIYTVVRAYGYPAKLRWFGDNWRFLCKRISTKMGTTVHWDSLDI